MQSWSEKTNADMFVPISTSTAVRERTIKYKMFGYIQLMSTAAAESSADDEGGKFDKKWVLD